MDTRRLLIGCDFTYVAAIPTPVVFQVQPAASAGVAVSDGRWAAEPALPARAYTDLYGNPCMRTVLPAGRSNVRYRATAVVPDATEESDEDARECAPGDLPDDSLIYTLPSRYCLPDVLGDEAWMEVWLGDRWWTFDPRNNKKRKGRVVIGRGRDASDVAMATTFGGPLLESMTVQAEETAA